MELALLNLRAARSTDEPRGGIDFVIEFMTSASRDGCATPSRARAGFAVGALP
jgi:hypothetical protein